MFFVCVISVYSDFLILTIFVTGWVNRFANAGDTAIEIAENTAFKVRFCSLVHGLHNLLKKKKSFLGLLSKQHPQIYSI